MQRILLIVPERDGLSPTDRMTLLRVLNDSGFAAKGTPLGGLSEGAETICAGFDGRPPHLLLVDLTSPSSVAAGTLPLRHIQRIQREAWGDDAPLLPLVALATMDHLGHRDLPAFVDDFILPPHGLDELLLRLRLLFFRRHAVESEQQLRFADLTLFLRESRAVRSDGGVIPLTPREWQLLHFLLMHRGKLFARERLLDLVWGVDYEGGVRTVDIHIRRLRAKLPPRAVAHLETRRGVGYGFAGERLSKRSETSGAVN